jgi:Flp pilus assembly protein TadD
MQALFKQIWQWFKNFFGQLAGTGKTQTSRRDLRKGNENAPLELSDTDYEFLFSQLLEGVAHGWHEGRILKFFQQLGERGKQRYWVAWLDRFGTRVLASSAPNQQLAVRMMRLGELAQSFPAIEQIGETSFSIGRQLYNREVGSVIWEYDGSDTEIPNAFREESTVIQPPMSFPEEITIQQGIEPTHPYPEEITIQQGIEPTHPYPEEITIQQGIEPTHPYPEEITIQQGIEPTKSHTEEITEQQEVETLTIEELLSRLEQDNTLVAQMAGQLGIETNDPQTIVNTLIDRFETAQQEVGSEETPETIEGWFNKGLQQANQGQLEAAIACWENALALNPNLAQAWHNRGSALAQLGRLEAAIASYNKAVEINPDDPQAWNARAHALFNMRRWEEAILCWNKVIEMIPNSYESWYFRGYAFENWGRNEFAIDSYKKALEIQPDFEMAKTKLDRLQDLDSNPWN